MKIPHKLYYIEWCDAMSIEGWKGLKEVRKWAKKDNWIIAEVGWIIKETKEYILFVSRFRAESYSNYDQYGGCIKIPTTWIKKRKRIKI